ncbi:MAG TPA: hypothetical protein VNH18_05790, partial [Bryobacteraceae bacterium]|nr:hypothetical protein [Bryobacteraceae bacterium]
MQKSLNALLVAAFMSLPVFAGNFIIQADNPKTNPEAMAKNVVVLARISSCHSPEKTTVTATADGIINGKRQTLPLKVIHLSDSGVYAVAHGWPAEGTWTVTMTATNPDYGK